jgi:G:T/U-mismatch repair DNA glycosylase
MQNKNSREYHPYPVYFPVNVRRMILGSFPSGKFTNPDRREEIKPEEIDFYFGSGQNSLWNLIGDCYGEELSSKSAIKKLLRKEKIGLANIIYSCKRDEGRAADRDLGDIEFNLDLESEFLKRKVEVIYFTSVQVMTWYRSKIKIKGGIKEVLLFSPSSQGARAIGRLEEFKKWRKKTPKADAYKYRLKQYRKHFKGAKVIN